MHTRLHFLLGAALLEQALGLAQSSPISIPAPSKNSTLVPNDLQAFSIEFSYFADYAGNSSHPNTYSRNLLENFKQITGVPPLVRVGGSTQDKATYNPNQTEGVNLVFTNPDDDQPQEVKYGPAFFESYHVLDNLRFIHGLNFEANDSISQIEAASVAACKGIGSSLHQLEIGNEVNIGMFTSGLPITYNMDDYIADWNWKAHAVVDVVGKACPDRQLLKFMAPSFIMLSNNILDGLPVDIEKSFPPGWELEKLFDGGYDAKMVKEISAHNYMGVNWPGPELIQPKIKDEMEGHYLNHSFIVDNLASHIDRAQNLSYLNLPYTLGETSSMAIQGREGLSNTFAMALWLVDYSLWAGSHNIRRLHFHQGTDYRYNSWQPISTPSAPAATRPPYYGQIMTASALANITDPRIVPILLTYDSESAYGIYSGNELAKIVVVNMRAFFSNSGDEDGRPEHYYRFDVSGGNPRKTRVERLVAAGAESTGNVTFGGVSYDCNAGGLGRPVQVARAGEMLDVEDGVVGVHVQDSSAVLLTFV